MLGTGTEQRISQLAQLVGGMDGAVIRLDAHTDARGTVKYNDELSAVRAESVRDALIRGGMPGDRIVVTASGELGSSATEQDVDGMALDRRVQIQIVTVDDASQVALTQSVIALATMARVAGGRLDRHRAGRRRHGARSARADPDRKRRRL